MKADNFKPQVVCFVFPVWKHIITGVLFERWFLDMFLVTSCLRSTSFPSVQHHHSGPHEEVEECTFVGNTRHFDNDRLGRLSVLGRHENRHRQASENRFVFPLVTV